MKKFLILFSTLLLTIPFCKANGEGTFAFDIRSGVAIIGHDPGVLDNWRNGWRLEIVPMYFITPSIRIFASGAYSRFPYAGDNVPGNPDPFNFRMDVQGEASSIYEFSVGTRLGTFDLPVNPFFSIRVGAYITNPGGISITWTRITVAPGYLKVNHVDPNTSITRMFGSASMGFMVGLSDQWKVSVEAGYSATFDGRQTLIPLLLGLGYEP